MERAFVDDAEDDRAQNANRHYVDAHRGASSAAVSAIWRALSA
jgi:hypothetical protein